MSRSDFLFMALFDIIFAIVTVPTEHRAAEKWAALKRLKLSMCRPLSTETLDLLEELEDIGFRLGKETSKEMKDAYLNVAVHITRDIVTYHGETMDSLGKISKIYGVWGERMNKEAAKNDNRLGSKELREWYEKIKQVGKSLMSNDDDLLRETVESLFRGLVDVQTSLVGYIIQEICEIRSEVSFIVDEGSTSSAQQKRRRCISPEPSELPRQPDITPRRGYEHWSREEEEALEAGVREYGPHNWNAILQKYKHSFKSSRDSVSLKDKWRVMEGRKSPLNFTILHMD